MKKQLINHVVHAAAYSALALAVTTLAVVALRWKGFSGGILPSIASIAMVATFVLQFTFVVVQLLPNGRTMVRVRFLGDGWLLVVMSTLLPGVLWAPLGDTAGPPMSNVMNSLVSPAFLSLLLVIGRQLQLRHMMAEQRGNTAA